MHSKIQRSFIPGDSWLYYKIYAGSKSADLILAEVIKPLGDFLIKNNFINKWFFLRYGDPNFHIRLRFQVKEEKSIQFIISYFVSQLKPYLEKDIIWKVQLDTYNRELERYGIQTMELSEDLFFYDSKLIVNFLNLIEGDEGDEIRWLFSLKSTLLQLKIFLKSDEQILNFLENVKNGFANEFSADKHFKKQLSTKYRKEKNKISNFMESVEKEPQWKPIHQILSNYEKEIITISKKIGKKEVEEQAYGQLVASYTHMHLNRLFRSKNRANEMVVYDFLYLYFKSSLFKKQKQEKRD